MQRWHKIISMKNLIFLLLSVVSLLACAQQKPSFTNVSVEQSAKILSKKDITILDVRTPAEWKTGIIEGAQLVNFYSEAFEADILKLDKEHPIFVYCKSGGRSAKAADILAKNGYTVYNLEGGMGAWSAAGKASTKP